MYATKAEAKCELEASKDMTGYFDGSLKMKDMKEMLRGMRFRSATSFPHRSASYSSGTAACR